MLLSNRKSPEAGMEGAAVSKNLQAGQPRSAPMGAPAPSLIDARLVITGNLQTERDVQLDGELRGDITCSQLTISRDAALYGNIVAQEVVVRGKVKGVIRADQVMLLDTAQVESEIFHKSLVVEPGASFDGESHRTDEPAAGANPRLADLKSAAAEMRQSVGSGSKSAAA